MIPMLQFVISNWKLALVAVLCAGSFYGGMRYKDLQYLDINEGFIKAQSVLVAELQKLTIERQPQTKTEVRTVYVEADPSGCADTVLPDGMLSVLKPTEN